jgi:hypothetical protein
MTKTISPGIMCGFFAMLAKQKRNFTKKKNNEKEKENLHRI